MGQFKHIHKMLKICLILAALSSVVFSTQLEDIADVRKGATREPKLFFVSSSSTTSTVTTFSNCYSTLASVTATCGRKRRAITEAEDAESSNARQGKFLLYWLTTTSTSTTTTFSATTTLYLSCIPSGIDACK